VNDPISVTLPNGVEIEGIPRGTSLDEIKRIAIAQGLAVEEDFGGEPERSVSREPMGPPDALLEQGAILQEENDAMSMGGRFAVGAGRGVDNLLRGAQVAIPGMSPDPRDPTVEAAYGDLSERYPISTTAGEVLGEAAPFAIGGYGAQRFLEKAGTRLLTRLATQGAIGGAEGGIVAAGREQNVPLSIAIGAGLTVGVDLVAPYVYRALNSLVRNVFNRSPKGPVINPAGDLSEETLAAAEQAGLSPDELIDEVLDLAERSPRMPDAIEALSQAAEGSVAATSDEITEVLSQTAGGEQRLASAVDPDPEIMAAAERLGLDESIPASAVSQNRAFQETEQALKAMPESGLGQAEDKFMAQLRQRADETIAMMGGTMDRGVLNADIADDFTAARGRLSELEGVAFDRIRNEIPATARAPIANTEEMILGLINSYGGEEAAQGLLTSAEKKVLKIMQAVEEQGDPTYAALDRLRKDIGQALWQRSGPFKDDATERLEALYGVLRQDQKATAEMYNLGEVFEQANSLTVRRKELEERMVQLFGRNLDKTLVSQLDAGVAALSRGDMMKLKKVMDALPAGRRQEAAASLLNRMFTSGARSEPVLSQGFVGFYDQLNRSPKVKEFFFSYLPEEAQQRMDDIYAVSKGFFGAKRFENTSNTARTALINFDKGGWVDKLYGTAKKAGAAEAIAMTAGIPPGAASGATAIYGVLSKNTPRTQAADALLRSPKFREALKALARGGDMKAADDAVRTTRIFREWLEYQPPGVATSIASIGFVPWLIQSQGEDDGQTE
jgi:hypothetical protein